MMRIRHQIVVFLSRNPQTEAY